VAFNEDSEKAGNVGVHGVFYFKQEIVTRYEIDKIG
jgi:hypothetical protein